MAEEVKVIIGKPIDPAEEKKLDLADMRVMISGPAQDVEGQEQHCYLRCPYCGCVGRALCSEARRLWYTCGCCGGRFWY
jgi:hypothetical protein